jgi:transcriptional regulator of heat shock response
MIAAKSKAEIKRKKQSRTIYLYDQAKVEDWENYEQELQNQLERKEVLKNIHKKEQNKKRKTEKINNIWDIIEEAIITAASKHIPKKKVFNTTTNRRRSQKEQQQGKNIVKLQKLIKYAKAKKTQTVTEKERREVNEQLKILGKEINAKLPKLQRQ